jgi:photosystem II stability/assembly factor-like uncharacterized protein
MSSRLPLLVVLALLAHGCSQSVTTPLPPLSSVTVSPATDTLLAGESLQLGAVARDLNGTPVASAAFSWSSSDPGVCTVSSIGRVTGVGEGVASVVATAGGLADTARITVFVQTGWYAQTSRTLNDLHGVCFAADGRTGVAVGDAGTVVRTANGGTDWALVPAGTSFALNDAWFTSATTVFAVGAGGAVLRSRDAGASWSRLTVPSSDALQSVCFADTSRGWVVGGNGTVLRTTDGGATWTRTNPTANTLTDVSFAGPLHGWAVGHSGTILGTHDGGASWYLVQPAVTSLMLRSVWRTSATAALAGGAQGTLARCAATADSLAWSLGSVGASNAVTALCMVDASEGWAVGSNGNGLVLRTTDGGVSWSPQVSNSVQALEGVWFTDAARGWAVGAQGRIVHTATGGR